ncbi:hypothetical protein GW17_00038801 [Ensete ventricosum]|nr:hypothetical protein GW17_00038801 [Ensete ventricosum]
MGEDGAWAARTTRGKPLLSSFPLLLPFFSVNRSSTIDFSLNQPLTSEIDRQRSILAVPPGNRQSTYRLAVGPCVELDKEPEEPEIDPINLQFYNEDLEPMLEWVEATQN